VGRKRAHAFTCAHVQGAKLLDPPHLNAVRQANNYWCVTRFIAFAFSIVAGSVADMEAAAVGAQESAIVRYRGTWEGATYNHAMDSISVRWVWVQSGDASPR
jgi:hypothetical protein